MKTGGSTFRQHLLANFGEREVYPTPEVDGSDPVIAYSSVPDLLGLPAARYRELRAYSGHFPFFVADRLADRIDGDLVTMTLLRDPVSRTISYLKDCRRTHERHRNRSLEEIYDDVWTFTSYIWDHQVKVFALGPDDGATSIAAAVEVDADRLRAAKENLTRVDVVGLSHHHDAFVEEISHRYAWSGTEVDNKRVGPPAEVPESLVERIREDNPADLDFWEFACELHQERAKGSEPDETATTTGDARPAYRIDDPAPRRR